MIRSSDIYTYDQILWPYLHINVQPYQFVISSVVRAI